MPMSPITQMNRTIVINNALRNLDLGEDAPFDSTGTGEMVSKRIRDANAGEARARRQKRRPTRVRNTVNPNQGPQK